MKSLPPVLVFVMAVLNLIPGLYYINLRATEPGDTSQPMVDFSRVEISGFAIRTLNVDAESLQTDDVVTAINGRPVEDYLRSVFSPQVFDSNKNTVVYRVNRNNQQVVVERTLGAISIGQIFKAHWSIYISLIYLEIVSFIVFLLRPRNIAAQLLLLASSIEASSAVTYFLGLRVDEIVSKPKVWLFLIATVVLYELLLAMLVHWSMVFPKIDPLLKRFPKGLLVVYVGTWLPMLAYITVNRHLAVSFSAILVLILQGSQFLTAIYFPLIILIGIRNYRAGNETEKRQFRWILWGLMISLIPYLILTVVPNILGMNNLLPDWVLGIMWCTIPTSFAIAILQERLFDIDVIIRRTLIYSTLTVALGAVFFLSVLLMQNFFQVFFGENQPPVATVFSTLLITVLFNPMRRRVQHGIDRRFYRRRYDAESILGAFAVQMRNEVEIETITEDLLNAVEVTMEPQNISFWTWKSKTSQRE